jgi:hypothetical protein
VTFSKAHRHLAEALESDESFLDLLKRQALSGAGGYKEEHGMHGESVHYDEETLLDYVVGFLGDKETEKLMKHIADCRRCAFRVLEMTRMGEEGKRDVLEWVDRKPFRES